MSRCVSCDKKLIAFELTRKVVHADNSVYYPDLCNRCYKESDLSKYATVVERYDLAHDEFDDEVEIPEE
jgi:hypothetical protein